MKFRRHIADIYFLVFMLLTALVAAFSYYTAPTLNTTSYMAEQSVQDPEIPPKHEIEHIPTPAYVKAIYMSQCLVADKALRAGLVKLINETELNSVVIDIKDYSGRISFPSKNPFWSESVSGNCYARDMQDFIESLHRDGIYTIGRVTVFQDPFLASRRVELAIKRDSDKTALWKDHKGISYVDPGARQVWDLIIELAREAHDIGFDELNFDYIRFPSDGEMSDIYFPYSETAVTSDQKWGKSSVLREFFQYLNRELKKDGIVISADLFGMTTTNTDDLNIGQILEDAISNFDYVSPMVYPSHYPSGFIDIPNPAERPYEVVKFSMDEAVKRASTTPEKLRPWLQDFQLGAVYTPEMVRLQIQAVYDSGLSSWMLWNASNKYTREALDTEQEL